MVRYRFAAIDPSGARATGVMVAEDEREIDRALSVRGIVLLSARPIRAVRRVPARVISDFLYHAGVLVGAGVPLAQCLKELHDDGEHPLAVEVAEISRRVERGASLSEALRQHPERFSGLVVSVVRAGEETGRLELVLRDLVSHLEWREALGRRVRAAIAYPLVVAAGVVGLCALLALFVVPRFAQIFSDLGVGMPAGLRVILWTTATISTAWPYLIMGLASVAAGGGLWQRSEHGRRFRHHAVLAIPLLRPLTLTLEMSRFCHNLALLYAAGLPILQALDLTAEIVQNRQIRDAVICARDGVRQGSGLVDALRVPGVVPPLVLRMLRVGESSGDIDAALERAARFYDRELPVLIDRYVAWFNTGVIVLLGAVLLGVMLSFFVPMYEAMGNLGVH